ncbi:unnamed protein product, partial [Staurois parvus]
MPTYQCLPICTSMPHISAHNATYQCQSEPPIECQSVPPISAANQCHLLCQSVFSTFSVPKSVPAYQCHVSCCLSVPISDACQCPSVPP